MTSPTVTPTPTETPLTDTAAAMGTIPFEQQEAVLVAEVVPAEFARSLERRLHALTAERDVVLAVLDESDIAGGDAPHRAVSLLTRVRVLAAENKRMIDQLSVLQAENARLGERVRRGREIVATQLMQRAAQLRERAAELREVGPLTNAELIYRCETAYLELEQQADSLLSSREGSE